jgi:hypothetical protein
MANKNRAAINLYHRKELKAIGTKIDSSFGAPGNNRKKPKMYKQPNSNSSSN